ncbi:hypothetical protein F6013_23370 [Salmonella enterica]|uniref:Uncharacterized protein n=3 Tax=Salmonella enterica TaxID=28901 RepID=A0A5Y2RQS3_SALER|nr:hypothetical protein [Salmonella enterica subsp. enterica serovar Newport]EAB1835874.1 hypothetical protein [Salmonella enterica]EBZ1963048.1 hypothetical protein [Salmonella enterica subsp. enterica serovar Bredeney]ECC8809893.1 hypothetical protein [Salmonella enterica subsp. enterica]ECK0723758.1 hypothetical protein [Salmonella enterica subsp. enterica serovar Anatum]ECM0872355.1 hypothetical protein [Salmonella enterica subsp. enterica serovar Infantis]ECO0675240.1 hypothetical protei
MNAHHRVESLVRFHYTFPVFCEALIIFHASAKMSKKIMGVFLLWLPEHLQSSDLLPVHAISPECLMAHSAVRLSPLCSTECHFLHS